jgi:hypothetical protein
MELNQAVITTKYIINDGFTITEVIKDEDGDFQFLGGQVMTEEDAIVVSLEQIVKLDKSVKCLLEMECETMAYRNSINDEWVLRNLE